MQKPSSRRHQISQYPRQPLSDVLSVDSTLVTALTI